MFFITSGISWKDPVERLIVLQEIGSHLARIHDTLVNEGNT